MQLVQGSVTVAPRLAVITSSGSGGYVAEQVREAEIRGDVQVTADTVVTVNPGGVSSLPSIPSWAPLLLLLPPAGWLLYKLLKRPKAATP